MGIILGASSYPKAPELGNSESFRRSADALDTYLRSAAGMDLAGEQILNLFNATSSPADQLASIRTFLGAHRALAAEARPSDLLLYFVGHGVFASDHSYCLAIQAIDSNHVGSSALRGRELADVLQKGAAFIRLHLVLDCCFAASLASLFQGSPGEVLSRQLSQDYPIRGVSLLCASGASTPAYQSRRSPYTTFTDALLKALNLGNNSFGNRMSMQDVRSLAQHILSTESPADHSRPEIHAPNQSFGDSSFFPFFPNPAFSPAQQPIDASPPTPIAQSPAVDRSNASASLKASVQRAVTEALAALPHLNGLHLSPTIPADELTQALRRVPIPKHASILGLGVINIPFKLTHLGRVLDSFVLLTEAGVYLYNTWNKQAATASIAYSDLSDITLQSVSHSYHVSRVGPYTHSTLLIGAYSMHFGDFGQEDKKRMGIGELQLLLTRLQQVLTQSYHHNPQS